MSHENVYAPWPNNFISRAMFYIIKHIYYSIFCNNESVETKCPQIEDIKIHQYHMEIWWDINVVIYNYNPEDYLIIQENP